MIDLANGVAFWSLPAFLLLDLAVRGRRFETTRWWRLRASLVTVFTFFWATAVAVFWGERLAGVALLDGSVLGTWGGAAAGILVYELFHYGYHRLVHRSDRLWRIHQMHHSAEANDAFGANYIHPLDAAAFVTIASIVFFPLLGLTPEAGAIAGAFVAFNAVFQHANIRTPRWLGYIIQRLESHQVHHGVHRWNYSDLPLVDMLFGTFRNPARYEGTVGFYRGASARIPEMLVGLDVTRPGAAADVEVRTPRRRAVVTRSIL